ncbi:MAG TPA: hypothetical protein VJ276_13570 [Thermoanaerobaculia bacterium]|nr:hypothetical protein [Thermoanaerobaculia bacterium]
MTTMSIEEVIKGNVSADSIDVHEPGGVLEKRATIIPGVPRFIDGERYILFLTRGDDRWRVLDLALGKFGFATDKLGRRLAVRNEGDVIGWDPDGKIHRERRRSADEFLDFLRSEARGGMGRQDYFVSVEPLIAAPATATTGKLPLKAVALATFSATSYTFTISGSLGGRWNVFPNPVTFVSVGSEPGAPNNGVTAIQAAFASWNGDPASNVNYVYGGAGSAQGGVRASDGVNAVAFERDLTSFGAPRFQCTSNSYSGTLGLGGITRASGTHAGPNNETFSTATEGDVEMNQGIANCTFLFNSGDFNSAVAHEVGHTLGFRHSDQTRADDPNIPCSTDPTLECSTNAIMKSFVSQGLNAALQPYDQHAVQAVYPGTGGGTVPATPQNVVAQATAVNSVRVTWNAVTGASSYEIYRKSAGGSFVLIGTSASNAFTDTTVAANTAYLYRVRALGSGGASGDSAYDLATTVIFTDDPLNPGTLIKAVHLAQLRVAVNAVRAVAGLAPATFTDAASPGVVVKAVHIQELRSALNQALIAIGFPTPAYTDPSLTGVLIKAVHFQELRNRVK